MFKSVKKHSRKRPSLTCIFAEQAQRGRGRRGAGAAPPSLDLAVSLLLSSVEWKRAVWKLKPVTGFYVACAASRL